MSKAATTDQPARRRRWPRRVIITALIVALAIVLYFALTPSVIDAAAWWPEPAIELSTIPVGGSLAEAAALGDGQLPGPEALAFDDAGRIYTGCEDGVVYRIDPATGSVASFATVGGRPLGLAFDGHGNLIVCNHPLGLQSVDAMGAVTLLTDTAGGKPIQFANDLAVTKSGLIVFSDSSSKFNYATGFTPLFGVYDMLEARPHGRLLAYDPTTRQTRVLLDKMYFPNGVTLSPDERFVLVVETFRYRVRRYYLSGDMAGQSDVWVDRLPGFADGIKGGGSERYYIAMGTLRRAHLEWIHHRPWVKEQLTKLPRGLWARPSHEATVLELNLDGQITRRFDDPSGQWRMLSSVYVRNGDLFLGMLDDDAIARFVLPR